MCNNLSELVQFLSDAVIFALQLVVLLLERLFLLQHREPVLRSLDLLTRRLVQLAGEARDLRVQHLVCGHLWRAREENHRRFNPTFKGVTDKPGLLFFCRGE